MYVWLKAFGLTCLGTIGVLAAAAILTCVLLVLLNLVVYHTIAAVVSMFMLAFIAVVWKVKETLEELRNERRG